MSLDVEIVDPRHDAEPTDWAAFAKAQELPVAWTYDLLRIETTNSPNPNLLGLVRHGRGLVAAFSVTISRPAASTRSRSVGGLARYTPRWAEVHQPWMSGFAGWSISSTVDESERRGIVRAFERAVCRHIGPGCLGVLYRNVGREQVAPLRGAGRKVLETMPTTVLENTFADREEWISSLQRGRRQSLRRQMRVLARDEDLRIDCGTAREDADGAALAGLLAEHRARFGRAAFDSRRDVSAEYLDALVRRPDVLTVTYHNDRDRLLAFTTMLDNPALPLHQHWAAVPVEDGGKQHLYFDCFARVIGYIVEHARAGVSAGRGYNELKSTLGFLTRPLCAVIVPRIACR